MSQNLRFYGVCTFYTHFLYNINMFYVTNVANAGNVKKKGGLSQSLLDTQGYYFEHNNKRYSQWKI